MHEIMYGSPPGYKALPGPKAPGQDAEEKFHFVILDCLFSYALWRLTPPSGKAHYDKNDNDEAPPPPPIHEYMYGAHPETL